MAEWFQQQAASGTLLLAVPVALVAGLVSFFSPCVIPLLPGYLSYATGVSGAELADTGSAGRRGRLLLGSVLFVLGFTAVFVAIGVAAGGIGAWLVEWERPLTVVLGSLTIVLGLVFLGVLDRLLPGLQRDWRVHRVPAVGVAAAPLLGVLFGIGWTPCIGPTLGVITTLSVNEATVGRGALLSAVYGIGLGIPFIVASLAYRRAMRAVGWIRRHQQAVVRLGGLMLVAVGVLLVTGWWAEIVQTIQGELVYGYETSL